MWTSRSCESWTRACLRRPGGRVTYLAEVDGAQAGGLPLSGWPGVLEPHPLRLPYAEPGGPSRELAWADATLEDQGFVRTGLPQQMRTWNLSSLWRIPVEGGSVWLKCVPPFFAHEGAVISRLQDGPVPQLLAHQAGRVLMPDIPGEDLYGAQLPTLLTLVGYQADRAAPQLARPASTAQLLSLGSERQWPARFVVLDHHHAHRGVHLHDVCCTSPSSAASTTSSYARGVVRVPACEHPPVVLSTSREPTGRMEATCAECA